jgi:hypothetical protein
MSDLLHLTVMPLHDAKDLQRALKDKGVEIILNHDKKTCSSGGCQTTVELLVEPTEANLQIVGEYFKAHYSKILNGHEINWKAMESVYDPSQESAVCPACGESFSTKLTECPSCGLVLG